MSKIAKSVGSAAMMLSLLVSVGVSPASADSGTRVCYGTKSVYTTVYGPNNHYHRHNSSSTWTGGSGWRYTTRGFGTQSANWLAFASGASSTDTVWSGCWQ